MVESLGNRVCDGAAEGARSEHDVGIREEQPFPARARRAEPERVILAEPSRRQLVDVKDQKTTVFRG